MIKVGHGHKVKLFGNAQLVQQASQRARLFRRSQTAELMQGDLKLKSSPAKAGGTPAGNIMPFKEQHVDAPFGQRRCRRKPSITGPNHHRIKSLHQISFGANQGFL